MSDYESNDIAGAARLARGELDDRERPAPAEYVDDPRTERDHLRLFSRDNDDDD